MLSLRDLLLQSSLIVIDLPRETLFECFPNTLYHRPIDPSDAQIEQFIYESIKDGTLEDTPKATTTSYRDQVITQIEKDAFFDKLESE